MQRSQAANHTHDLLTQRIQLCCEILQSVNWKLGQTLFRDSTSHALKRSPKYKSTITKELVALQLRRLIKQIRFSFSPGFFLGK